MWISCVSPRGNFMGLRGSRSEKELLLILIYRCFKMFYVWYISVCSFTFSYSDLLSKQFLNARGFFFFKIIITRDCSFTKLFSTIKVVRLLWIGIWELSLLILLNYLLVLFLWYVSGHKGTSYNHSRNNNHEQDVSLRELFLQFFSLSYSLCICVNSWTYPRCD